MDRKRKIALAVAAALAALAFIIMASSWFRVRRSERRVAEFVRHHAAAPRQAEAVAERVAQSLSPRSQAVTTPTLVRREIGPLCAEFATLVNEYQDAGIWLTRNKPILRSGVRGVMLVLPESDFIKPGETPRLAGLPALRERIRQEVASQKMTLPADYRPELPPDRASLTTGPLAVRLHRALDQAAEILTGEWDELTMNPKLRGARPDFIWLGMMAVERAAQRGQTSEAGRMLEGLVRASILLHLGNYPFGIPNKELQATVFDLGRQGKLDESTLARLEHILARGRLSDAEVAGLRAAFAMRQMKDIKDSLADPQVKVSDLPPGMDQVVKTQAERWILNDYYAALAAWAAGDGAAFDQALANPVALMLVVPRIQNGECPGHQAGFGGESTANDALDTTRLFVAAERWRLVHGGAWPTRLDDLRPWLDSTFDARPGDFWALDAVREAQSGAPAPGSPASGTPAAPRPVIYHAWRTPLSPIRYVSVMAGFDDLNTHDAIGMVGEHPVLGFLGLRAQGQMLDLCANKSENAIVVRAVWPCPETIDLEWLAPQ